MMLKIFSVFDSKMAVFDRPGFGLTDNAAIRDFADGVNDPNPQNKWAKHPEDFSLYCLGEFNDQNGEVIPCMPRNLMSAAALKDVKVFAPPNGEMAVVN